MKRLNLPNSLTLLRIALALLFVLVTLLHIPTYGDIIATALFVIAALTDALDGYIARKHNLITVLGQYMDPLADKMLTAAALIVLVSMGRLWAWAAIVIISREFAVTGLRILAASNGIVIPASPLGKIKTTSQMVAIPILLLEGVLGRPWHIFGMVMMLIALVMTLYSAYDYFHKCKPYLFGDSKKK